MIGKFMVLIASVVLLGLLLFQFSKFSYDDEKKINSVISLMNQAITHKFYSNQKRVNPNRKFNNVRIIPEADYCTRSDSFKFFHPDVVMLDTYSFRDSKQGLSRKIIKRTTFDSLPKMSHVRKNKQKPSIFRLPLKTTILYPYYESFFTQFQAGKAVLCMFQKFNHMLGKHQITYKNSLMNNFYKLQDHLISNNASEECINNATYIPKTYRLYNTDECRQFFTYVQSEQYNHTFKKTGPQFLTKMGLEVHRGKGITVLFDEQMKKLINNYKQGELCESKKDLLVAQRYVSNPYLYKKHKIEFRIYFFVASTYPLIVYSYKRALIKRCAKEYSLFSTEKAAHVCNTAIVKKTLKDSIDDGEEDGDQQIEDEEFFIDWNLEGLQDKLFKEGKITSNKWLDEYLYPQIHRHLIHVVRSAQKHWVHDSKFAEFFAADFLLSDDLKLYILEINFNPQILSVTEDRVKRNFKMVEDQIEIMNAYLRSKFLRIRNLIIEILEENRSKRRIKKKLSEKHISKLIELYKDQIDDESLSPGNLFTKIIDHNKKGTAIYNNIVGEECMI